MSEKKKYKNSKSASKKSSSNVKIRNISSPILRRIIMLLQDLAKEFIPKTLYKLQIFKKRPLLIVFLVVMVLITAGQLINIGFGVSSFVISIILYMILLCISFSNLAEKIMQAIEDCRRVATSTEKERLLPLFDEVYTNVKKTNKNISEKIHLYIVDSIEVNAFAIGSNTIAITRGLMQTMSDEEIKGIFAHEFSHIITGDTLLSMIITVVSVIYTGLLILCKVIMQLIKDSFSDNGVTSDIISFIYQVIDLAVYLFILIVTGIIAGNDRKREYFADMSAYDLSYGTELLSALYKLYDIQVSDKRNLMQKIKTSHPKLAYRIEKIEEYINL